MHNLADLPGQTLLSPETAYPSLIGLGLVAAHLARPGRGTAGALLGWAWLHLVGGGVLSVLPLEILPYQPEQSLRHYTFHALYLAAQVPLIIVTTSGVRRPPTPPVPTLPGTGTRPCPPAVTRQRI